MIDIKKTFKHLLLLSLSAAALAPLASCKDQKSYSDLLREEEVAVNKFLADNTVETSIPEDSVFIEGEKAPFYRMNRDGTVYMRVITKGDMDNRPQKGQTVYFRFMSMNLKNYESGSTNVWTGNAWNMDSSLNGTNLIYGNSILESTTQYGDGLQVPLEFLGYNSEVELIVKSIEGFTSNVSQCIPYLYRIRYFRAQY